MYGSWLRDQIDWFFFRSDGFGLMFFAFLASIWTYSLSISTSVHYKYIRYFYHQRGVVMPIFIFSNGVVYIVTKFWKAGEIYIFYSYDSQNPLPSVYESMLFVIFSIQIVGTVVLVRLTICSSSLAYVEAMFWAQYVSFSSLPFNTWTQLKLIEHTDTVYINYLPIALRDKTTYSGIRRANRKQTNTKKSLIMLWSVNLHLPSEPSCAAGVHPSWRRNTSPGTSAQTIGDDALIEILGLK